jgi:hypothetical protein
MGLRFRRSIKLAPGLRMNFGLKGMSMSAGPRGFSVTAGSRGTYANVGLPGSGVSVRTRIGGGSARRPTGPSVGPIKVAFRLEDDGTVDIVGEDGSTLPPRIIKMARTQDESALRSWLEERCDNWNKGIDALLGIHLKTPPADRISPDASRTVFGDSKPAEQTPKWISPLARIFRGWRERIERQNAAAKEQYEHALAAWIQAREAHDQAEAARLLLFSPTTAPDVGQVQEYLAVVLARVEWPRETIASLEVDQTATRVLIDVDLPEIEDMPDKEATVAARGLRIIVKDRSATQRRREYMTHVHGVAFRVIGEVFAALPRIERVMASGFSQRADRTTGQVSDEYLFSIRVARSAWSMLNFSRLDALDLPACLGTFDIRRAMTSTGIFKPIQPFASFEDVSPS